MAAAAPSSSDKRWVTDLENQNIDGSRRLRHLLTTCADPIQTIRTFQEKNSIKVEFWLKHGFVAQCFV